MKKRLLILLSIVFLVIFYTGCAENANLYDSSNPTKVYSFYSEKTGQRANFMIVNNTALYAWGDNKLGQLGLGDYFDRQYPTRVYLPGKPIEIMAGSDGKSIYAILDDGSLYAWGECGAGQLGVVKSEFYVINEPRHVKLRGKLKKLIIPEYWDKTVYAILEDDSLYAWGDNTDYQIGLGSGFRDPVIYVPRKVLMGTGVKDLVFDSNEYHITVYAITTSGALFAWGNNDFGQIGVEDAPRRNIATPREIYLDDYHIDKLVISSLNDNQNNNTWLTSKFAFLKAGSVYAWGFNGEGCLGVGDTEDMVYSPKEINIDEPIKELIFDNYTNEMSTFAVTDSGALWAWGSNSFNNLGIGSSDANSLIPVEILPNNYKVKEFKSINKSSFAVLEDNSLYTWGNNNKGQLCLGSNAAVLKPQLVNQFSNINQLYFSSSSDTEYPVTAFALLNDGSLYGCGANQKGQLATGNTDDTYNTVKINLSSNVNELTIIDSSIIALLEDGSLYSWGDNTDGVLGTGSNASVISSATKINLPDKVKKIYTYNKNVTDYRAVITTLEDNSTYAWGKNTSHRLGVGQKGVTEEYAPLQVDMQGETVKDINLTANDITFFYTEGNVVYSSGNSDYLGYDKNDYYYYYDENNPYKPKDIDKFKAF